MLHAFDAANGHEDWAFIPENIQGKLKDLTGSDCHKYYVDLTPYVTDAWDESEAAANKWKTVLIGGNRLGGPEYFALDVTVPTADGFKTMWDVVPFAGENKLSTTMTAVGKVKANGGAVDHWVAIVTSGYQDDTVHTGKIAALKISNGQKASIWDVNGDGLYGPYATTQNKAAGSPYYSLTSPAAIDSDLDGYLDLIYAGDTEGTLWKFFYDFHDDGWKKAALFNTGGQPITATPALAFDADGNLRIYFGTGKYLEENDKADETRNGFYCLVDAKQVTGDANNGHYTGNATILKSDLADLTAAVTKAQFDGDLAADVKANATSNGWYFELDADSPGDPLGRPAERILGKALVVSGVVFFASFVPNQDVCGYGGSARLYAIDYIYGIVDDEPALTEMTTGTRYQDIGAGIPAEPVYYFDPQTKETRLFIQKSDSTVVDPTPVLKERPMQVQSWKAR
jgi:type IV pilus assembly protein PilY1